MEVNKVKQTLDSILFVLNEFKWLLNSYVLDFYVDKHWERLPASWIEVFQNISPNDLATLLSETHSSSSKICLPLSILAFKCVFKSLNVPRQPETNCEVDGATLLRHPKLKYIFEKHLKPKKRHEVDRMSRICYETARKLNVEYIVDFGAGLGHLSRVLAYGYGLKLFCLEQQDELNRQADQIDANLERLLTKYIPDCKYTRPIHRTLRLTKNMRADDLRTQLLSSFQLENSTSKLQFGIIGLHPCGDLTAMLMRLFLEIPEAKFINLVGCCYMKLSPHGYPLSKYVAGRSQLCQLEYASRELACHANEMYHTKLNENSIDYLRIHAYRAAIEQIITTKWPHLKHSGLLSIRYNENLDFIEYCKMAVTHLNVQIEECDIGPNIWRNLNDWYRVVIFYTLRLMFAPLIESVILLDRALFILESGSTCNVAAIFDPHKSPRNHITTCIK